MNDVIACPGIDLPPALHPRGQASADEMQRVREMLLGFVAAEASPAGGASVVDFTTMRLLRRLAAPVVGSDGIGTAVGAVPPETSGAVA